MTERRPLAVARLRPRLIATFALVAAVTAVAVAVTSFALVRRAVLDRAGDDALRAARSALTEGVEALPPGAPPADVIAFANRLVARSGSAFDVVTVMPDGTTDTTSISTSAAAVPAELAAPVAAGRLVSVRTDVAGRSRIVVGGQVPDVASLYLFFPLDDIDRDLSTLRTVLAGVALALVVLSALVGALAARALLRPLRRARRAVHRLEVGLLETRLPVAGNDEFADLAASFNRMAAALETHGRTTCGPWRPPSAGSWPTSATSCARPSPPSPPRPTCSRPTRRGSTTPAGGRPGCWWSSPGAWAGWWPT